ncbi:flagellar biosynthesis anti-sigma factor FlgM [Metapseudomonas resinovorans]|uniref:Negative regulator of flagellin synthesis n=1 Tax=Metapseudomonas resinovorans NBRC 106553 TaxID=1245471 RepID=S6AM75_METRE|nr:flagellar biosynthesis anti-sigma factor FlgM [Pseudomonas resinovorans]BAN49940.1 anti-sigma 28 factor [Pseudomonas resinovorans NBRC 106553]
MEISRHLKSVAAAQAEAADTLRQEPPKAAREAATSRPPEKLQLDQMQQTLREMPDVDLARIEEIRQALRSGGIETDARSLAASILGYHTGSES